MADEFKLIVVWSLFASMVLAKVDTGPEKGWIGSGFIACYISGCCFGAQLVLACSFD